MMTLVAEQTFAPPGPGSWFLDPTHWTRPVTRFHAEIFPDAFQRGFCSWFPLCIGPAAVLRVELPAALVHRITARGLSRSANG